MNRQVRFALVAAVAAATAGAGVVIATSASAATESRPFPFHVTYQVGVMPSASAAARDAAVKKQYDSWKANYLVHGCASNEYYVSTKGDGDAPNNGPVSEGQGYGMNIVPLMAGYDTNAKAEFDGLWQLVKDHRDPQGMMQWQLDGKTCKYADSGTPDGATDGDLDIGYGLILADKQWGGYTADAKDWLAKFYAANVTSDGHLKCEDDGPTTDSRPSDWMLDHLRAFAAYDTAHDWNKVITKTQNLIQELVAGYSPTANLLSDFVVNANTTSPKPAPANYQENQPDNIVGYNSIRVPWHMGTDALLYGNSVSLSVATHESNSYKSHSGGDPKKVYPHTNLDGTPHSTSDTAEEAGDSVGPSAMAAGDQAWTDTIWNYLATNPFGDGYFGETIKMLVYVVMAGDYWAPGASTGPSPTPTATSASPSPSPSTSPTNPPPGNRIEAETGTISSGGTVDSNHAGFTGTGFVNVSNAVGSYVEWTVSVASAGPYTLSLRYSNGTTAGRPMTVTVAGASPVTVNFPVTADWDTWATATATVNLAAGANTIRATSTTSTGGPNLDWIQLDPQQAPPPVTHVEAETGTISTGGTVDSNHAGFTGTGFVNVANAVGSYVEWTLSGLSTGSHTLTFRYSNGTTSARPVDLSVNGSAAGSINFGTTADWDTWASATVTVTLTAGTDTIRATSTTANGGPNLDWVEVS
jgi:endo-1,4-beta-D-glucanase Y